MGFSFQELMIVMLIGLIVLGPERLPRIANQIGGWLGKARRMTRVMKRQLEDELNFDKDFEILPPDRTRHANPGSYKPAPFKGTQTGTDADSDATTEDAGKDDSYSPAHDEGEVGTGVNDDPPLDDDADPVAVAPPPETAGTPAHDNDKDDKKPQQ